MNPELLLKMYPDDGLVGGGGEAPAPEGATETPPEADVQPEGDSPDPRPEPKWLQNVPKKLLNDEMKGYDSEWDYLTAVKEKRDELTSLSEVAVKPLGEDATDEEVSAYRKAMGIPETPDGYEFEGYDKELAAEFAKKAHELNLTQSQAKALADFDNEQVAEFEKQQAQERLEIEDKTRSELKQMYPNDWEQRLEKTNAALRRMFGEEGMKKIRESGLGIDPAFVKGSIEIAKRLGEGRMPAEGEGSGRSGSEELLEEYPSMKPYSGRRKSWAT